MKRYFIWLIVLLLTGVCGCSASHTGIQTEATQAVPVGAYIQNKGSDTMVNLALAWVERYQQEKPDVRISVTGGGSGTGITALKNNTVDIANASRQITAKEQSELAAQGTEAVEFIVARDAIAVIVNRDNPIERLTLEQVSQIFTGRVNNWSELGGDDRPIVRTSRETNSGTHVFFLEEVIRLGNKEDKTIFSADTLLLPSSEGIIAEVRDNPNAIGYDGLGYITDDVKVIALAAGSGEPYVLPSVDTVMDGSYPIARDLYVYTRGQPQGEVKNYLDWIFTPEAQKIVSDLGFVPVVR